MKWIRDNMATIGIIVVIAMALPMIIWLVGY